MNDPTRRRRPDPERSHPIRNWGTIFGAPPGRSPGAAPEPPPGSPFAPGPQASGPASSVSDGVQMGYRVVEEYLRQGQQTARMMYGPWLGGGAGAPWTATPWQGASGAAVLPLLGPWMELVQAMLGTSSMFWAPPPGEVHGAAGPFTAGRVAPSREPFAPTPASAPMPAPEREPATGTPGTPRAASAARPGPRTVVSLEVPPGRRAEVTVDLQPGPVDAELVVHSLRPPVATGVKISGVTAVGSREDDIVRVTVRVPADLAPGMYSGLVIDRASGLPRGAVSVRVSAGD